MQGQTKQKRHLPLGRNTPDLNSNPAIRAARKGIPVALV